MVPVLLLLLAFLVPSTVQATGEVWTMAGDGTVTLVHDGSTGVAEMTYVDNGPSSGQWGMSATSASSQQLRLDWTWTGFHSFFAATADLKAFVTVTSGPDRELTLVHEGPRYCGACQPPSAGFAYSGTTVLDVGPGDDYGFVMTGSHGDIAQQLNGHLTVTISSLAGDLVTDGGFEQGSMTNPTTFDRVTPSNPALLPPHWSFGPAYPPSQSIDWTGGRWPAAEGDRSLELNGDSGGSIYQDLATVNGQQYTISFDYSANPDRLTDPTGAAECHNVNPTPGVAVLFGGVQLGGQAVYYQDSFETYNGSSVPQTGTVTNSTADMLWRVKTFTATATGPTSRLQFDSVDFPDRGCGIVLDDIHVVPAGSPPPDAPQSFAHQTVNTADDHDDGVCGTADCSLREAINASNAHPAATNNVIDFGISESGLKVIQVGDGTPEAALPEITTGTTIDATTQSGTDCSDPSAGLRVELRGTSAPGGSTGLRFGAGAEGSRVKGLIIDGFGGDGIAMELDGGTAGAVVIQCNVIGTSDHPNGGNGISLFDVNGALVGSDGNESNDATEPNLISNNALAGISVATTGGAQLANGIRMDGNVIRSNGGLGIDLKGDNEITQNDAGDVDGGPNGTNNYPGLVRAEGGPNGGISGVLSSTNAVAGQDVTLYLATSCDPTGYGEGGALIGTAHVVPNSNGEAAFSVALAGMPTTGFVTATATDSGGNTSEFSACVPIGPGNDSWPNALDVTSGGPVSGVVSYAGQTRWYKVLIAPGGQVSANLTNLPADFDLLLFKDISQAYTNLTQADSLAQLGAEFSGAGQKFSGASQKFSGAGQKFSDDVFSGAGQKFSGAGQKFSGDLGFSGDAFAGAGQKFSGDAFSGAGQKFSPTDVGGAGQKFSPEAYSSAQSRSLIDFSAATGNGPESITANTWTNTGYFYLRVSGRNGAFDPAHAFSLNVTQTSTACVGLDATPGAALPVPSVSGKQTIILTDPSRIVGTAGEKSTLATRLATFAARGDVAGVVVDVGQIPRIQLLNAQADDPDHRACPFAKNVVAMALHDVVDSYRALNPGLKYVVLVGGDSTIPFFRYPDTADLAPESGFVPPVAPLSASEASLRLGYVLSQDAYGARTEISQGVATFPIPDLAVGRLVENAAEATGMLDAYLSTTGGVIATPTRSLSTGYDFMSDAASAVQDEFVTGIGAGAGTVKDSLIAPNNILPSDPQSWTASALRTKLLDSGRHDLIFLAGHFNADKALAADFSTYLTTGDLASSSTDFTNSIIFSQGCHSGYNLVDDDGIQNVSQTLDWAQAFARKRATFIGGTGYQYGDTDLIQYSEAIYSGFAHELLAGTGPVPVGQALIRAKQAYLRTTPTLDSIDTKALLESTLFGLPMLQVDLPGGRGASTSDPAIADPTPVDTGAGASLGLRADELTIDTSGVTSHTKSLTGIDGASNVTATWYSGPDGIASSPDEPALPLFSKNASVPGTTLRGVGFRGGSYADLAGIVPLSGAPATEVRTSHSRFDSPTFFPATVASVNYFGALGNGSTRLLVTPAQHRSEGPTVDSSTLRLFTSLDLRLYYSNFTGAAALSAPPSILDVSASVDSGFVTFATHIAGDPAAGIQGVWIAYTGFDDMWHPLDLEQDATDPSLWTGSLPLGGNDPADLRYLVQAVNGVGLVAIDHDNGAFYSIPQAATGTPNTTQITLDGGNPASGPFGSTATFGATLSGAAPDNVGEPIIFTLGGASKAALTDASGHAQVTFTLNGTPGDTTVAASFVATPANAASFATHGFTVTKLGTELALTGPASGVIGADSGVVATLTDGTSAHDALGQRTVFFLVVDPANPANAFSRSVITDYLGRASLGPVGLPVGTYSVVAKFNGSITLVPSSTTLTLTDDTYDASTSVSKTYQVVNPVPTVTSVVPGSVGRGAVSFPVSIVGTGFVPGSVASVSGTGVTVATTYVDGTHLTALVSVTSGATIGNRNVTVTNPGTAGGTCTNCLNINLGPYGLAALPTEIGRGAVNETISIIGINFVSGSWTPASVVFSGTGITVNSVTRVNSLLLTVNVSVDPAAATTARMVTVINPDGGRSSSSSALTVTAAPSITSLSPDSRGQGAVSETVVITGANFRNGSWTSSDVTFSGTGITVNTVTRTDSTHLSVKLSIAAAAATGARDVTVRNVDHGRATLAGAFSVNAGPGISTLSPNSRGQGATSQVVTITGSNFLAGSWPSSAVAFSGSGITVNSVSRTDASHLSVNVTVASGASTGARDVTVRNLDGGRATLAGAFTVSARPTLTSLSPSSRARGQSNQAIVLTGTGFLNGATVTFSGSGITVNSVTWNSATKLTINISVAGGASTGNRNVTVTNPDQGAVTLNNGFKVT